MSNSGRRRSGDDKEEIKRHHNVDLAKPIRAAIQFDDGVFRSQIDGGKSWGTFTVSIMTWNMKVGIGSRPEINVMFNNIK